MPAAQLCTAAIERVLNHLLKLDAQARIKLEPLSGKRLKVTLKELPWPLVFVFTQRVEVLAQLHDTIEADCQLGLSLATLDKLQDTSQLTRLIQQNELTLEGDMQVAQQFSEWMKSIDIDWEEQLSAYTGDVLAHSLVTGAKAFAGRVHKHLTNVGRTVSDALVEEKRVVAHPVALANFSQQVNTLRSDVSRFEARLQRLEQQAAKSQGAD